MTGRVRAMVRKNQQERSGHRVADPDIPAAGVLTPRQLQVRLERASRRRFRSEEAYQEFLRVSQLADGAR